MVMMAYTLHVVVFMTLVCLRTTVGSLNLEALCWSRELCNRTSSVLELTFFDQEPCCVSCSCDPDCVNIGNCCPDIGDAGSPIRPLECILPVVNPDYQLLIADADKWYGDIQRYQAVAECPEDMIDDLLRFKCEEKEAEYPNELVIVADRRGHLFKNEFCARCNGVDGYTPWQLRLRSPFMKKLFSYFPSLPFSEFKNCMFWSAPPNPDAYEGSRCFSSIDTCNETGLWTGDANPHLNEMCNNVSLYYIHYTGRFFVYKNPFCFLCNIASELRQTDLFCDFGTPPVHYDSEDVFSAVLSTVLSWEDTEATERRPLNCERDHLYDPFSETCRQLICPVDSFPVYGECPDTFEEITGVDIAVTLTANVYVTGEDEAADIVRKRFDILTKMEDALSLTKQKCQRCHLAAWSKRGNGKLHLAFRVIYTTESKCPFLFLKSALTTGVSAFAKKIRLDPGTVTFVLSILPGDLDLIKEGYAEIPFSGGLALQVFGYCSSLPIDFNEVSFCPRFEFSEELFELLKRVRGSMPEPHIVKVGNQSRYAICVEEYLAVSTGNQPLLGHYLFLAVLVPLTTALYSEK